MNSVPTKDVQVRNFRRSDRDQLTDLINAHVAAVVPGVSLSVNAILAQLEREPGEFIVDRWVRERATLVAEQRGRIVAAAHLCRYADAPSVTDGYRDAGELRWVVCWPAARYWSDSLDAGAALIAASVRWLQASGARKIHADGALPAPGVFGIPQQWQHIVALLEQAGFHCSGRTELVLLAEVHALPPVVPSQWRCVRTLGSSGTRLTAVDGTTELGYIEVDLLGDAGRTARHVGWADIANLHVDPAHRRAGVGSWLVAQASRWLRLGHVDRLLDYCAPEDDGYLAFLQHVGFEQLTLTSREWTFEPSPR